MRPVHPTQNSFLREVEPRHHTLAMNARSSPRSVVGQHAEDEVRNSLRAFGRHECDAARSTSSTAGIRRDASERLPPAARESALAAIWTRGGTRLPKTTYQWWKSEAAGACPSKWQVVAAAQDSSKSKSRREQKDRTINTNKKPRYAQHGTSLTRKETRNWLHFHLTDCAADHNFSDAQVRLAPHFFQEARLKTPSVRLSAPPAGCCSRRLL